MVSIFILLVEKNDHKHFKDFQFILWEMGPAAQSENVT